MYNYLMIQENTYDVMSGQKQEIKWYMKYIKHDLIHVGQLLYRWLKL